MSHFRQSIFQTDWWCDASNPGGWEKVEAFSRSGAKVEFIYARQKKYGFYEVGMPYLARVMEPIVTSPDAKFTTQLTGEVGLIASLVDLLPKYDHFWYTLPPECDLELAFNLSGFLTEGQYTFRYDPKDGSDPWKEMDQKTRNRIRTGLKEFELQSHNDIERFINVSKSLLSGKSWFNKVDYEAVRRIWDGCVSRGQGTVISAIDDRGHDVASAVLVCDDTYLYYWLSARDPEYSKGNANSALIWTAIVTAIRKSLIFDMDGYASPASGVFYAKFGLKPYRRTHISSVSTMAQWAANSRLLIKSTTPVHLKNQVMAGLANLRTAFTPRRQALVRPATLATQSAPPPVTFSPPKEVLRPASHGGLSGQSVAGLSGTFGTAAFTVDTLSQSVERPRTSSGPIRRP